MHTVNYEIGEVVEIKPGSAFGGQSGRVMAVDAAGGTLNVMFADGTMKDFFMPDIVVPLEASAQPRTAKGRNNRPAQKIAGALMMLVVALFKLGFLHVPGSATSPAIRPDANLRIVRAADITEPNTFRINGFVMNDAAYPAENVVATGAVLDSSGQVLASQNLDIGRLEAGGERSFSMLFELAPSSVADTRVSAGVR